MMIIITEEVLPLNVLVTRWYTQIDAKPLLPLCALLGHIANLILRFLSQLW